MKIFVTGASGFVGGRLIRSEAALQDTQPLMDIDETAPYPREPNSYRGKAKQLAEREILDFREIRESTRTNERKEPA